MLAIREQSWLFPSDFPLRDMQNIVKCPIYIYIYTRGYKKFWDYFESKSTDGSIGMCILSGLSSNRHQAVYQMASFCEHCVLCYGRFCNHVHGHICSFITCDVFWLAHMLHELQNITGWRLEVWANFHELNPRNWCVIWNSAGNTNIWYEHAPQCCKVRVQASDPRSERTLCRNLSRSLSASPG